MSVATFPFRHLSPAGFVTGEFCLLPLPHYPGPLLLPTLGKAAGAPVWILGLQLRVRGWAGLCGSCLYWGALIQRSPWKSTPSFFFFFLDQV